MLQLDREAVRAALPWDALIEALEAMFRNGCEAPLRHLRDAGFIWVKVDRSAAGNAEFLARYPGNAEAPAPHLLVLDADAQVLHGQSVSELLRKGRPDRRRIRAFLEDWAPPPEPAPGPVP